VLYDADERFPVGGSKVLKSSASDQVALIGAGVTLHNCLEAAGLLAKDGITARVIDLYSVKPIDVETLRKASADTGGRLVVAEDHYPQGGLAAAVMEALAFEAQPPRVAHCAVRNLPTSGSPTELMEAEGITADHIADAARSLLAGAGSGKSKSKTKTKSN
jgi:transketolase